MDFDRAEQVVMIWPCRLLGSAFTLMLILFSKDAQAWEGVVRGVHDGDTILVAPHGASHGDLAVRLYGIDAPELDQPGGENSRDALQRLVQPGETVNVVPLAEDRHNRVIGLIVHDELILNYELIRQGHAWVYPMYCKARFCREWNHAEEEARKTRTGLWDSATPTPPWDWRKQGRK